MNLWHKLKTSYWAFTNRKPKRIYDGNNPCQLKNLIKKTKFQIENNFQFSTDRKSRWKKNKPTYNFCSRALFLSFLVFFSCGDDEMPTTSIIPPPLLFYTVATSADTGGKITPTQNIAIGQTVSITATPNKHYRFKAWAGDCPNSSQETTIRFDVDKHCSITAIFEKINYQITAISSEGGSITGLPSDDTSQGQAIILRAVTEENHLFVTWKTDDTSGCPTLDNPTHPTLSFIIEGPCALEAIFKKAHRTITTSVNAGGHITPTTKVEHGQEVSIAVTLEKDYALKTWAGNCGDFISQDTTVRFIATKDCQINAVLEKKTYRITATSSEGGSIGGFSEKEVLRGEKISLTALADENHVFVEWIIDDTSDCPTFDNPTHPTLSFIVKGPCALEAIFKKAHRTITTSVNAGGHITPTTQVEHGQEVSINVTLDEGYVLKAWTGDCGDFSDNVTTIRFTAITDCHLTVVLEKVEEADTSDPLIPSTNPSTDPITKPPQTTPQTRDCNGQPIPIDEDCPDPEPQTKSCWDGSVIPRSQSCPMQTKDCNGQPIPIDEDCPEPEPQTKSCWDGSVIPRSQSCPMQTKDCNGQPIPIDEDCPDPEPQTKSCWDGSVIPRSQSCPMQTKDCNGQPIPIDEDCPEPEPQTKSCWDGSVIPRSQSCPMQTKDCNGQPIPVDEDCPDPEPQTKTCWDGSVIPRSQSCPVQTKDCNGQPIPIDEDCPEPEPQTKDCHGQPIPSGDTCPSLLKKHQNSVTVIINPDLQNPSQYVGQKATVDGTEYTIVDNASLKKWVAANKTNAVCTTLVTDMSSLFLAKTTFNQDIRDWDVSSVTTMNSMFLQARSFNQDIGDWDVGNVTNMHSMFFEAYAFNHDIGDWDVSEVTTMEGMFSLARAFNQNISKWEVDNVTNMQHMFDSAALFNHDIGDWDVSEVTTMFSMFKGASMFNQDIGEWEVDKVTNMRLMFNGASAFNQDINDWTVSKVTNMESMFSSAHAFNGDITSWNVGNVINMNSMFSSARVFNQNISSWNVSSVEDMAAMFNDASAFNQNISSWDVSSVTECTNAVCGLITTSRPNFSNCNVACSSTQTKVCHGVKIPIGDTCPNNLLIKHQNGVTVIINPLISNPSQYVGKKAAVDGTTYTIVNNASLKRLIRANNTDAKCTTLVTNMSSLFVNNYSFNQDIGDWDTSNVTTMYSMFQSAVAFNQDITSWNVGNVTSMRRMFFQASVFNQDIGDWNVSSVTDMGGMFSNASVFNQDIGDWNVSIVNNMQGMFSNASIFNHDLSEWSVAKVTNCSNFYSNSGLTEAHRPSFTNCNP